jgi:hypothetical protein
MKFPPQSHSTRADDLVRVTPRLRFAVTSVARSQVESLLLPNLDKGSANRGFQWVNLREQWTGHRSLSGTTPLLSSKRANIVEESLT